MFVPKVIKIGQFLLELQLKMSAILHWDSAAVMIFVVFVFLHYLQYQLYGSRPNSENVWMWEIATFYNLPFADTKLYRLVKEAYGCEQLA